MQLENIRYHFIVEAIFWFAYVCYFNLTLNLFKLTVTHPHVDILAWKATV